AITAHVRRTSRQLRAVTGLANARGTWVNKLRNLSPVSSGPNSATTRTGTTKGELMNSRKRKITTRIAQALAIALVAATAFAVHDKKFELDGNIINDGGGAQIVDWADLFTVTGGVATPKSSLPSGFSAASFVRDFTANSTKDASTFATGSKDTLNIGGGGWQCTKSNNISDKVDVLNAYATAFVDKDDASPTFGHTFVYFAMEVASN